MEARPANRPTVAYKFADFHLEPSNARLLRSGAPLTVEPKALRVLEVLIEHEGHLVDRDTLLERVWGRVIVTPGTLTRLVAELRRVLGDDASDPHYIGTVHTRGYRWLAPTTKLDGTESCSPLPERTIRLVGRAQDLANLERIVSGARLVTLVGPGGTGKTQLALELGRRRGQQQRQPVAWIDLTTATDLVSCHRLVASAIDAHERGDLPLERSIALVFGERAMLVILDNCERVVSAVAALAKSLLAYCPHLTILCTSQVTLDIAEETLYWVAPLSLPPTGWESTADPVAAVLEAEAVQLFIERACAIVSDFKLDAGNAPVVAEICCRLDGLPLALELAAARLAALSPPQLLAALEDRFAVLARQVGTPHQRHQSLQGAIEWSYAMLEPSPRELLDLFGVFSGSWSIEAAQAVAGHEGGGRVELLNQIQILVQRSLVTVERNSHESRYRLLDSVSAFARARLAATGRDTEARVRHARCFTQLATTADAELLKGAQLVWLERVRLDWTNLIAAYEWARGSSEHRSLAAELAAGLRWFFWLHSRMGEAAYLFRDPGELAEGLDKERRARLFNGIGCALFHMGDFEATSASAAEAAQCATRHDQPWELAFALGLRAWATGIVGQEPDVENLVAAAIEAGEAAGDPWVRGFAAMGRAWRAIGAARHSEAAAQLAALAEFFAPGPDRQMRAFVAVQYALQLFILGRHGEAQRVLRQALRWFTELRAARGQTGCCELMAYLAASNADHELAARLLGAAITGRETTGAPLMPQWIKSHDAAVLLTRQALGDEEYERAVALGRRSSLVETSQLVEHLLDTAIVAPP